MTVTICYLFAFTLIIYSYIGVHKKYDQRLDGGQNHKETPSNLPQIQKGRPVLKSAHSEDFILSLYIFM